MSESSVKNSSSCLAITEKKAQKPGGCVVGIFFQLFEWKKKLAKKKLFSKKLLPPAKKFRGDEKMPNSKLHLIANENSGGFPSAKKGGNCGLEIEQKSETRVPGLVARLMGLEHMPAAKRDKSKKASYSDSCGGDGEKKSIGNSCELDGQSVDLEIGVVKNDSRPHKLQKTGGYETRAVTRFGAEALQIKSVLSRARKHNHHHNHHPKLTTPLKSPRITSGKSASRSSRLIGAATRILEPSRSRTRGSITYPGSMYPPKTGIATNCQATRSAAVMQNRPDYDASTANPLAGQTSCKNCGNLLDVVVDCKPDVAPQHPAVPSSIVSDVTTVAISTVSAQKKGRLFAPSHEQERDVVLLKTQEKPVSHVTEKEHSCNEYVTKRMSVPCKGPSPWNSPSQSFSTLEGADASSFALKHKTQTQERMLISERISSGSTMSNTQVKRVSSSSESSANGTKDFVALNRGLVSGQMRTRSPSKVDSSKYDLGKRPCHRQNKSLSDVRALERKRRTPNAAAQVEGTTSVNSVGAEHRNLRPDPLGGKRRDFIASSSLNSSNVKSKQCSQGKTVKVNDNKINEVVSFSFNSPLKQKTGMVAEKEVMSSNSERMTCFQRPSPLRVNALGAFLEQKLKELTSQEEELAATGAPPKKSTAMILQELISALSAQHLICRDGHMFNENVGFHDGAKQEKLSGTACSSNHLSPGSVLEASFSSSSLDESSGHGFHPDSMNYSYDQPEPSEHDTELLDSATLFNKGRIVCEILTDLVDQIPGALQSFYPSATSLARSKIAHMKDVILIVELVLGIDTDYYGEDEAPQLLIYRFLFDELDAVASDPMWTDFSVFVGFCEDSRQRKELKGFIFDCVIEYLESSCCRYFNCGLKMWWTKKSPPQRLKAEMLAREVKMEIAKWECMAGMAPDEIIEWEMSHSLGKWIDFDIEAFESGVDIGGDIFQILVDEVVEDLVGFKLLN